jgi:hypothetical protein
VAGNDLDRLKRADEAVQWTRRQLPHGRGNVDIDLQATDHESYRRTLHAQSFCRLELQVMVPDHVMAVDRGAVAMAVKAGCCDDTAGLVLGRYGPHAADRETLFHMAALRSRHAWAEVGYDNDTAQRHGKPAATQTSIMMDPWAQGPAVFSDDRCPHLYNNAVVLSQPTPAENAAALGDRMWSTFAAVADPIRRQLPAELQMTAGQRLPQEHTFTASPVMGYAFAARAQESAVHGPEGAAGIRANASRYGGDMPPAPPNEDIRTAIDRHGNSLRDNLVAVSAARATGANVGGAARAAPAILQAVQALPFIPNVPAPTRSR